MKATRTNPKALVRRKIVSILVMWTAAAAVVGVGWTVLHLTGYATVDAHVVHTPSVSERLAAAHGCWDGPPPADMVGKIPGHAVVSRDGGRHAAYVGKALTGQALDQTFGDAPRRLVVYAFCR